MTWRLLVTLAGIGVIGAATHANVEHAGGYASPDAPIIISLAFLLSVGIAFCGYLWGSRQRLGAVILGACILSGEAYWVLTNTEREIAAREERDAPVLRAIEARDKAEKRVARAETALVGANADVAASAAKKDCARNCAMLLAAAVTAATTELSEARTELSKTPRPTSVAPLPARLGIAPWLWDLIMAGLRSLAVVGASIAVGLATHRQRTTSPGRIQIVEKPVPLVAKQRSLAPPRRKRTPEIVHSARNHAAEFGIRCMQPDPHGEARMLQVHERYKTWCSENSKPRLPAPQLAQELAELLTHAGIHVEDRGGGDLVVRGVRLV